MPSTKPSLQLKTPMTSTFPSELSALSARSPFPGFTELIKQEEGIKTPITPPIAYIDFLKTMSMASPIPGDKSSGRTTPTSAPSTGSSEHSDCSCNCETHKSPTATTPNPFVYPSSAPSTARLGRLRIPTSPAYSSTESPLSTSNSAVRSSFSAKSARSPFDWDIQNKGRYFDVKSPKSTRSSVPSSQRNRHTHSHIYEYTADEPRAKGKEEEGRIVGNTTQASASKDTITIYRTPSTLS